MSLAVAIAIAIACNDGLLLHHGYSFLELHGNADTVIQAGASVEQQVQHLGQKYLGARPMSRADVMFNSKAPQVKEGHPVPVTNFMNAQCKSIPPLIDGITKARELITSQTSLKSPSVPRPRPSRLCWTQAAPTFGFPPNPAAASLATCTLPTTRALPQPTRRMVQILRSSTALAACLALSPTTL